MHAAGRWQLEPELAIIAAIIMGQIGASRLPVGPLGTRRKGGRVPFKVLFWKAVALIALCREDVAFRLPVGTSMITSFISSVTASPKQSSWAIMMLALLLVACQERAAGRRVISRMPPSEPVTVPLCTPPSRCHPGPRLAQ